MVLTTYMATNPTIHFPTEAHFTVFYDGVKGWTITKPGHTPSAWFNTEAEAAHQCANANKIIDQLNDPTLQYYESLDT